MADAADDPIFAQLESLPLELELLVLALACDAEDVCVAIVECGATDDLRMLQALVKLFDLANLAEACGMALPRISRMFGDQSWWLGVPGLSVSAEYRCAALTLQAACGARESMPTAQWVAERFKLASDTLPARFGAHTLWLIETDLELIRWVVTRFKVTGDDACGYSRFGVWLDDVLLSRFCRYGTVGDVKWIIETLDLDSGSTNFSSAFADACDQCNLGVVMWMSDQCDADDGYYDAIGGMLYRVCEAGDLESASVILDRFGQDLVQRDPSLDEVLAICSACTSGNLALVSMLAGRLTVPSDATLHILDAACRGGNLDLVAWVSERFDPHTATRVPGLSNRHVWTNPAEAVLREVCEAGHADVAIWLIERYQITAAGVCEQQPLPQMAAPVSAWEWALQLPDRRLARWMSDRYEWGLHVFM